MVESPSASAFRAVPCRHVERRDGPPRVAVGQLGDSVQRLAVDRARFEPLCCPAVDDFGHRLDRVAVELHAVAHRDPGAHPFVEAGEQVHLPVRDTDPGEPPN